MKVGGVKVLGGAEGAAGGVAGATDAEAVSNLQRRALVSYQR